MNEFGLVILIAMCVDVGLSVFATLLNVSALTMQLPVEFAGIFDSESYSKSQSYTKSRSAFTITLTLFTLGYQLAFWFLGGYGWADELVRDWDLGDIGTGLAYIGLKEVADAVVVLPFSLYSTFVIEARFGFNKTTAKTFIKDRIKALLLLVVIGGPVLAALLYFFENAGDLAWLWAFIAVTVVSLLVTVLAPVYILPLFLKLEPLEDGELRAEIVALAARTEFAMKDIYVVDGSTRSAHSNAFFIGMGKNKCICLFDTLVDNHSVSELIGVLAHEIGHDKMGHTRKNLIVNVLHNAVLFFLLGRFIENEELASAFDVDQTSVYVGFVLFSLLYTPVEMVMSVLMNVFSRHNEYEADRYSIELTRQPQHLISALKQLSKDNLSNLTPHWFHVFLSYSHPPMVQRLHAIRKWAEENVSLELSTGVARSEDEMKAVV